jgi:hypothetical protein
VGTRLALCRGAAHGYTRGGVRLLDIVGLLRAQQLLLLEVPREGLALAPRRAEDDRRQHVLVATGQDHADHLAHGAPLPLARRLARLGRLGPGLPGLGLARHGQPAHGRLPRGGVEGPALLLHEVEPRTARRVHVVPQRRRPALGVHDVARVAVQLRHPPRHLVRVGQRRREKHVARAVREQDEGLLDGPAARRAAEQVHLVEDDPLDLAHQGRAGESLQPQYLGGHDEAARVLVDGDVACDETDVAEEQLQLAVLLVRQRLDRRRVDHALAVSEGHGDGVLGTDGLPRRGVSGHQDRLAAIDARARGSLEAVEPERKLASWQMGRVFSEQRSLAFCWGRHLANRQLLRCGRKARRHGHAVLE